MPRKTLIGRRFIRRAVGFNEAAARCRGKRTPLRSSVATFALLQ